MAEKLSTGLRNFLLGEGSLRKAFEDCVIKIYSGSPPASADSAVTGVHLVTITTDGLAVNAGDRSTPKIYQIAISGTPDAGDVVKLLVDSVAYNYTLLAEDDTLDKVAAKVARMLNDIDYLDAIPSMNNDGLLYVKSRIDGEDFTITENTSTGITVTVTQKQAASRKNTLYFDKASSGAIVKPSGATWKGTVLTSGVAGYFRIVRTDDDGGESTTQIRAQGAVSTSGAELNLSNISLTAGTTITIDSFSMNLPAE